MFFNKIEHWVYLRYAGIRLAQYTDTSTCHQHKKSRLTTNTDLVPPHTPRPWHHSHRNNCTHNMGCHGSLTGRPGTSTGLQAPHKHTDPGVWVRDVSSSCRSTWMQSKTSPGTHIQISSQFRKTSSPLKLKHPKYITSQQCAPIGCTRQEVDCCCCRPTPPCLFGGGLSYFEVMGHPVPVSSLGFKCSDCFIWNCSYIVYSSIMKGPFRDNCIRYFYI